LRDDLQYPEKLGEFEVENVRDLTVGYDSSKEDKRPVLPVSKSTEMITFYFTNGCLVTLRTSGTEPKIKYYMEMKLQPGDE
jgi:phosphomannomutase